MSSPSEPAASPFGLDSGYSDLGAPSNRAEADLPINEELSEKEKDLGTNDLPEKSDEAAKLGQSPPQASKNNALIVASAQPTTPSVKDILISGAINFVLPFINGMMLGFGEIFAHELGFRWGWSAARVSFAFDCGCIQALLTDFFNRCHRPVGWQVQVSRLCQSKIEALKEDFYYSHDDNTVIIIIQSAIKLWHYKQINTSLSTNSLTVSTSTCQSFWASNLVAVLHETALTKLW